jgi:hypothetical protein
MNTLIRTKAPHGETAPGQLNQTASNRAVEIEHRRKTYGTLVAVDDVSFSVAEGEIFGILGPNGAGDQQDHAAHWQPRRRDHPERRHGLSPGARCAMVHRWLADKCSCAWLGQRVAGLRMLTLLQPGQPVTLY